MRVASIILPLTAYGYKRIRLLPSGHLVADSKVYQIEGGTAKLVYESDCRIRSAGPDHVLVIDEVAKTARLVCLSTGIGEIQPRHWETCCVVSTGDIIAASWDGMYVNGIRVVQHESIRFIRFITQIAPDTVIFSSSNDRLRELCGLSRSDDWSPHLKDDDPARFTRRERR